MKAAQAHKNKVFIAFFSRENIESHFNRVSQPLVLLIVFSLIGLTLFGFIYIAIKITTKATAEATHVIGSGGNTEFTAGTGSSVTISASSVILGPNTSWWDASWNYKKQLTINNPTASAQTAGTEVKIAIDTSIFESLQADCDDLRIVYQTQTELSRTYYRPSNYANCNTSKATQVTFALQANLAAGANDATNYSLYYGNASASTPSNALAGNTIGGKSPTLVCPFNGTATCLNGVTPSTNTATGRYSMNSAMSFDGVDDRVTTPTPSGYSFANGITMSAWIYVSQDMTSSHHIISQGSSSSFQILVQTGSLVLNLRTVSSSSFNDLMTSYSFNEWTHIACTYDNTVAVCNKNGVEVYRSTHWSGTLFNPTTPIGIGGTSAGGQNFTGGIDEVAGFDRALNSSELSSLYTFTPLKYRSNMQFLYHFDENGSDPRLTNVPDATGLGRNGVITGAPKYQSGVVGDNKSTQGGALPSQGSFSHDGIFIEEATTNLITNPSLENATSFKQNWTADGVGLNNTSLVISKFGSKSAAAFYSPGGDVNFTTSVDPGSTAIHTFSVYVQKRDTATNNIAINNTVAVLIFGGSAVTTTYTTTNDGWWRLTYSGAAPAGATTYGIRILANNNNTFFDAFQLEQKPYATSYTDGTLGTGYSWTGTAHNSTSTRAISYLSYPTANNIDMTKGTFSFWLKPNWTADSVSHTITQNYVDANNFFQIERNNLNQVRVSYKEGGVVRLNIVNTGVTMTNGNWYHVVVVWDSTTALTGTSYGSIIVNNNRTNDSTSNAPFTAFTPSAQQTIGNTSNLYQTNGVVSDFRVYNQALTTADINQLYLGNQFIYNDAAATSTKYASQGTWTSPAIDLNANGLWGTAPNFTTTESLGTNSIGYETRSSDDSVTWTNYEAVSGSAGSYNITSTPKRYFQVKSILNSSNQLTTPSISNISFKYFPDVVTPPTNASNLRMYQSQGGSEVLTSEWTSGLSPNFTWDAGADDEGGAGLKGYCLYLGQSNNPDGDPSNSKGLLGTTPVALGSSTCQFITSDTNINFSNTALRGATWLTSSDSPYYFKVRAIDLAGNKFVGTPLTFIFKFDNSVPSNPSALSAPQGYQRDVANFTVTWPDSGNNVAFDGNSQIKGYQYKINNGLWQGTDRTGTGSCEDLLVTNSYTLDPGFDTLVIGENLFYLRVVDNACNISTEVLTAILKYSSNAPSSPRNLVANPTTSTSNSFSFLWEQPTTFTGDENKISYCYTVNTLPTPVTCTWTSEITLSADAYATQPGKNDFYVVSRDEAGNVNYDDAAKVEFNANTSAPSIVKNLDVSDISTKITSNWKLAISWDEPTDLGAGVKNYKVYRSIAKTPICSSDLTDFTVLATTTGTSYIDTKLQQKDYYYCVKACDSANNCSAVSNTATNFPTGRFIEPAILISGPATTNVLRRSALISWVTDRRSDSKIALTRVSGEYPKVEQADLEQVTSHAMNLIDLEADTQFFYKVKWTDEDGNTGVSDEKSFTTLAPPIIQSVVLKKVSINSATVQFTTVGASIAKIYYSKSASFENAIEVKTSTSSATYTVEIPSLQDNSRYYYKVNTLDSEGFEYNGTTLEFTTPPLPRISNVSVQEKKGVAQPTIEVTWDSNTDISSIVSYGVVGETQKKEIDLAIAKKHDVTITNLVAETSFDLQVSGFDIFGNQATSDSIRFKTSTDTRPPSISKVKAETSSLKTSSSNNGAQIIISWETDEPSTSQVEFSEGTGNSYGQRTQEDSVLTTRHLVVLSNLPYSKVYHFRVISSDKAKNESKSGDTVIITPNTGLTALELIVFNITDLFSILNQFK